MAVIWVLACLSASALWQVNAQLQWQEQPLQQQNHRFPVRPTSLQNSHDILIRAVRPSFGHISWTSLCTSRKVLHREPVILLDCSASRTKSKLPLLSSQCQRYCRGSRGHHCSSECQHSRSFRRTLFQHWSF